MSTCGGTGGRTGGITPSVGSFILSMKENGISSKYSNQEDTEEGGRHKEVKAIESLLLWGLRCYCTRIIMEVAPSFPKSSTTHNDTTVHGNPYKSYAEAHGIRD